MLYYSGKHSPCNMKYQHLLVHILCQCHSTCFSHPVTHFILSTTIWCWYWNWDTETLNNLIDFPTIVWILGWLKHTHTQIFCSQNLNCTSPSVSERKKWNMSTAELHIVNFCQSLGTEPRLCLGKIFQQISHSYRWDLTPLETVKMAQFILKLDGFGGC